jgi:hypothetical protein
MGAALMGTPSFSPLRAEWVLTHGCGLRGFSGPSRSDGAGDAHGCTGGRALALPRWLPFHCCSHSPRHPRVPREYPREYSCEYPHEYPREYPAAPACIGCSRVALSALQDVPLSQRGGAPRASTAGAASAAGTDVWRPFPSASVGPFGSSAFGLAGTPTSGASACTLDVSVFGLVPHGPSHRTTSAPGRADAGRSGLSGWLGDGPGVTLHVGGLALSASHAAAPRVALERLPVLHRHSPVRVEGPMRSLPAGILPSLPLALAPTCPHSHLPALPLVLSDFGYSPT